MKRHQRTRNTYEKYHGITLSDDLEVHHIIPVYAGGTDDIKNLVALTREEHKQAHLKRYEETSDFRDLCAYHMIGYNFSEAHRVSSSVGGTIGGKKVKKLGVGICTTNKKLRAEWASKGGKVGGRVQKEKKLGIHGLDEEQKLLNSSKGGKSGAFTNPKIQSELGKRGGKGNSGFVWITDGTQQIKYTRKSQEEKTIEQFLKENPTFRLGRFEKKKSCFKCGKTMNARGIARYHNERCKNENQVNN